MDPPEGGGRGAKLGFAVFGTLGLLFGGGGGGPEEEGLLELLGGGGGGADMGLLALLGGVAVGLGDKLGDELRLVCEP